MGGGRQYTGRIVTVTNDKICQEPVYNYSRDLPFICEEMQIPVAYKDDRVRVEDWDRRYLHRAGADGAAGLLAFDR